MPLEGEYAPATTRFARFHAERYEASGGSRATSLFGRRVVILTHVGRTTGALRKTPLMRVEHDGVFAVIASRGGAPEHPAWYGNVTAHPHVELQDRTEKHDYRAREVTGAERALWWDRAVAAWPGYAKYQTKTDRVIPVLVLERVSSTRAL